MNRQDDLKNADLHSSFLRLAFPNILANLTTPIAGLVDTAMLGHLSAIGPLAGVALGALVFDYLYWSFGFLRMGTTGLTAQAFGRGEAEEVQLIFYRSALIALGISISILLLQVPLREIGFGLLSGTQEVESSGRLYFNARIWGCIPAFLNFVIVGWFLGRGESKRALWIMIVGNLSNIVLDYWLIVHLDLQSWGAGIATMLSQYLMLALGLYLFLKEKRHVSELREKMWGGEHFRRLLELNRDLLLRTFCLISAFAVFTNLSAIMGTSILAANAIFLRFLSCSAYLTDGYAFAIEALAGFYQGRREREEMNRIFQIGLAWGVGSVLAFIVLFIAFRLPLYALITSHADVVHHLRSLEHWFVGVLFLGTFAYIYDGFFLGITEGRVLRNSMFASLFLGFVPVAILAHLQKSENLLWLAFLIFMVFRGATLAIQKQRLERAAA